MTSLSKRKKKEAEPEAISFKQNQDKLAHYERESPTLLSQQSAVVPLKPINTNEDWLQLRGHLEARLVSLRAWRESWWMQNWSDLAEFILPRRSIWMTQSAGGIPTPNNMTRGREINKSILDPTATYAARVCAGGLVSGLASPSRPWFKLKTAGDQNSLDSPARAWLDDTEDRIYRVMAESNFYDSFAQECEDVIVFGTAPQIIYEDEQDTIRCYNPCVGEYMLAASSSNRIDGLYRQYLDTISQAVDYFGIENVPEDIQKLWQQKGSGLDSERIIAHSIEPNYAINSNGVGNVKGNFTWREVYWMYGAAGTRPLALRGFHEQPFTVSRWSIQSNDAYGRGPGMDVMPDVLQLQVMTKRMAEAIEKQVRPPLIADMALKNQPSSILPGHVTYVQQLKAGSGMRPIYEVNPDINAMSQNIQAIQMRIKIGLFNDVFMAITNLEGDQRTATEIQARISEAMQVLGPVIESMMGVLKQKLKRIYGIMKRRGLIRPPPQSLQGNPVNIEFVSLLAIAQKGAATGSMERMLALIGQMAQAFPEARDLLNPDNYIRDMGNMLGTPQNILRGPNEVAQRRQANNQMMDQAHQMGQAQAAAGAAKDGAQAAQALGSTPVGDSQTALNQLLGIGGGGK